MKHKTGCFMLQNSGFCYLVFEGGEIEERDFLTNQTSSGEADKSAFDQIIGNPPPFFKSLAYFSPFSCKNLSASIAAIAPAPAATTPCR